MPYTYIWRYVAGLATIATGDHTGSLRNMIAWKREYMEITLTPDIEQAITEQAQRQGTTPEQLALECLHRQFVLPTPGESSADTQGTLADFLAGFVGVLHSSEYVAGEARMSEATGKTFAEGLRKKRQQGRL